MWIRGPRQPGDRQLRWRESFGLLTVDIGAPREVLFDVAAAPYLACAERSGINKVTSSEKKTDPVSSIKRVEPG